ncbi:hypothetical protein CRUP_025504 [Coryphaenoides rupestris]|nr:hypothetical protein CRUP_025504 [Coryphaenoides rupestris]
MDNCKNALATAGELPHDRQSKRRRRLLWHILAKSLSVERPWGAVERLQARLRERAEEKPTEEKLSLLRSVLQSPLFHQILALQKSRPTAGVDHASIRSNHNELHRG